MEFLLSFGSTIWTYVIPFLVVLSILVFVHEYGHYIVARWNGVRVDVFSIGFGKELFGYTDSAGTRWKFSLLPLGGYVKMHGDADASSSTIDHEAAVDPDSFPAKNVFQRMSIIAAGPLANILFAVVALALLFMMVGRPFTPATVGNVEEGSPAAAAGLMPFDRVVAVDGDEIDSFEMFRSFERENAGTDLVFTVERGGQSLEIPITPRSVEITDEETGESRTIGLIGVERPLPPLHRVGPVTALIDGTKETWRLTTLILGAVWQLISGNGSTDDVGGPIRIAQITGELTKDGLFPAVMFTVMLSINLGLINLFPIPVLDGGHLVMLFIELVRGKPLNERSQEIAFRFGLALVLSLMVFATLQDLSRFDFGLVEYVKSLVS